MQKLASSQSVNGITCRHLFRTWRNIHFTLRTWGQYLNRCSYALNKVNWKLFLHDAPQKRLWQSSLPWSPVICRPYCMYFVAIYIKAAILSPYYFSSHDKTYRRNLVGFLSHDLSKSGPLCPILTPENEADIQLEMTLWPSLGRIYLWSMTFDLVQWNRNKLFSWHQSCCGCFKRYWVFTHALEMFYKNTRLSEVPKWVFIGDLDCFEMWSVPSYKHDVEGTKCDVEGNVGWAYIHSQ